jgi:hypothetical protein
MRSAHDEQKQPNLFMAGAAPGLSLIVYMGLCYRSRTKNVKRNRQK